MSDDPIIRNAFEVKKLVRHSLAVSTFSLIIANELKWNNKVALEKLSVGGLLHDIGLNLIPKEILAKPLALLTPEELAIYETHPYKGMEMMMSLGFIPDDIISIIFEHEENRIGQGYPRKIRGVKMHPLARIVSLADAFAELVIQNVNQPIEKTPKEAIYYIEKIMGQPFDKEAFNALKKAIETHDIFKIENIAA
ncbi:HD domain-containing protein [bacterium]|nr:HD domain-containing protein [bacterium]